MRPHDLPRRASFRTGGEWGLGIGEVFRTDLTLLHAPSVYDFRKKTIMQGPVADAIPSTDEFEMYPVGLTSIASYLGKNQYNVRIINLAYRMLQGPCLRRRGEARSVSSRPSSG